MMGGRLVMVAVLLALGASFLAACGMRQEPLSQGGSGQPNQDCLVDETGRTICGDSAQVERYITCEGSTCYSEPSMGSAGGGICVRDPSRPPGERVTCHGTTRKEYGGPPVPVAEPPGSSP